MQIIRATKTAEQAGAYYVRIQAMARKHQITLYAEFDEHDTPETKYIVVVDDYLPVATCRLYAIDSERVMLGRNFYETMGYVADYSQKIVGETFTCYRMEKQLK